MISPTAPAAAPAEPAAADSPLSDAGVSNGEHARRLIHRLTRRLVALQAPVLEDTDPEPLHQMRVSMRRLRTVVRQFGPALDLPGAVTERRIGRVGRRLGLARDLDVLRDLLEQEFLPHLPQEEVRRLRAVRRRLRRERALAAEALAETLRGGAYLGMLERLQRWHRRPAFTPLGEQPLREWLVEWQAPLLAPLFLHPGWFVTGRRGDPESVHDLRKTLKAVRYSLENLEDVTGEACRAWALRCRHLQTLLGDLNDLRVLRDVIEDGLSHRLRGALPAMHGLLRERGRRLWQQWREEAEELQRPERRHALLGDLLPECAASPPPPPLASPS
ncbi:MAG: CHAD domain-containing protein [Synechococcaceae cyanobacterium]|nr:CHAD domain-containing protein [Synechococcaceae cyanobacterium]